MSTARTILYMSYASVTTFMFVVPTAMIASTLFLVEDSMTAPHQFVHTTVSPTSDQYGKSLVTIGDIDGNGYSDMAVGIPMLDNGDDGGYYIHFRDADRSIMSTRTNKPMGVISDSNTRFGYALAPLGDIDGNGVPDIAVTAPFYEASQLMANGQQQGALFVQTLASDGSVLQEMHIKDGTIAQDFTELEIYDGASMNFAYFGTGITNLGDIDGFQGNDFVLAIGASGYDYSQQSVNTGGVLLLFFKNNAQALPTLTTLKVISGDMLLPITAHDRYGASIASLGDINDDGLVEIAVGAVLDDGNQSSGDYGAVYVHSLSPQGDIVQTWVYGQHTPELGLVANEYFGSSVVLIGDTDDDGRNELFVGSSNADTGTGKGYIISFDSAMEIQWVETIEKTDDLFATHSLHNNAQYGSGAWYEVFDNKRLLHVGTPGYDPSSTGAFFTHFLGIEQEIVSTQDDVKYRPIRQRFPWKQEWVDYMIRLFTEGRIRAGLDV